MTTVIEQPGVVRPPPPTKKQASAIRVSPLLIEASRKSADEVFALLNTSAAGLTQSDAEERLAQYGLNEVAREKRHGWLWRLWIAARNPLVILLTMLRSSRIRRGTCRRDGDGGDGGVGRVVAIRAGDPRGHGRRQTEGDDQGHGHGHSRRTAKEIPLQELVPGDVIKLAAGDMIPADVRLVAAKDLFIGAGQFDGRIVAGGKNRRDRAQRERRPPWNCAICVSSAPAWRAARPARSSWRRARTPISAAWPAASSARGSKRASTGA